MRASSVIAASLVLAACSPSVPDSGRGVGFQDYDTYLANRQAVLAQPLSQGAGVLPAGETAQGFSTTGAAAAIANAQGGGATLGQNSNPLAPRSLQEQAAMLGGGQTVMPQPIVTQPVAIQPALPQTTATARVIGATPAPLVAAVEPAPILNVAPAATASGDLAAVRPRGNAPAGISETVSEMAVVGGVSDEQDFEAVAARETIESDKARLEKNRAQYQIDQPGALPQRDGVGPSVVEYALATQHPRGVKLFQRSPLRFKKIEVACAPYANDDLAQEAFLAAGGPNRDRLGMDPDGDGYACGWDPAPYRAVLP
jgi:hypothetical protein